MEALSKVWSNPEYLFQQQLKFSENFLGLWGNSLMKFLGETSLSSFPTSNKDKRFKDPAWQENFFYDFIKQTYFLTAEWVEEVIKNTKDLDKKNQEKTIFYLRQFISALAPTNFIFTNPAVIKETIDTKCENIVKGMQNFLNDLKKSNHFLNISTNDSNAYEVGKNLAVTPGKVIYQNDLIQLIHYTPTQKENYAVPILIIPPFINKYYILDLTPENSFVKWLLDQGHAVFLISWVNPTKKHRNKNFEDYMQEGVIAAINAIEKTTGAKEVSAIGYCIGGTLLACSLAYMAAHKDNRVKSATFLTTLTDFSEVGELGLFIDEEQIQIIEQQMKEVGYFDGNNMATTFSLLRANDMIWSFFVSNYLLGKDPMPFDILYWNSDSTRLAEKAYSFYLRNMYKDNLLISKKGITLADTKIDLSKIKIPCYMLSAIEDHIVPWKATYKATKIFKKVKFVLSGSGHVAGVVNHPSKGKYCYWENDELASNPQDWFAATNQVAGSWWPNWHDWQKQFAGKMITAKRPEKGKLKAKEAAPGSYVRAK
jgi:polyhydroxyalkanoate synthase